jgi:hypothetical protein
LLLTLLSPDLFESMRLVADCDLCGIKAKQLAFSEDIMGDG